MRRMVPAMIPIRSALLRRPQAALLLAVIASASSLRPARRRPSSLIHGLTGRPRLR
jgi:hypothetical protein